MDTIGNWLKARREEFRLARRHWPLLVKDAFFSWLWLSVGALGLGFLVRLVACVVTYWRRGTACGPSVLSPDVWWAAVVVSAVVFVYRLVMNAANRMEILRIGSDKFTWNDVEISLERFADDYVAAYGITIANRKPFTMTDVLLQATRWEVEKVDRTPSIFPAPLAWLADRQFGWSELNLLPRSQQTAVLFAKAKRALFLPLPDSQPGEKKSMGGFFPEDVLLFLDLRVSCVIDGYQMEKSFRIKALWEPSECHVTLLSAPT